MTKDSRRWRLNLATRQGKSQSWTQLPEPVGMIKNVVVAVLPLPHLPVRQRPSRAAKQNPGPQSGIPRP